MTIEAELDNALSEMAFRTASRGMRLNKLGPTTPRSFEPVTVVMSIADSTGENIRMISVPFFERLNIQYRGLDRNADAKPDPAWVAEVEQIGGLGLSRDATFSGFALAL